MKNPFFLFRVNTSMIWDTITEQGIYIRTSFNTQHGHFYILIHDPNFAHLEMRFFTNLNTAREFIARYPNV
jgi:hypothetical protein